jgi:hypothetical protein
VYKRPGFTPGFFLARKFSLQITTKREWTRGDLNP